MRSRVAIGCAVALWATAACLSAAPAKDTPKKPNVIVIVSDDQGYADLEVQGAKDIRTPNIDKLAAERLEQTKKMAESIVLPEEINEETVKAMDEQTIDDAFNVNKEFIAIQYDLIFGDGTFEKVYEKYPDIMALEDVLEQVGHAVAQKVEDMEKERHEKSVVKVSDHLKKKASKK